MAKKYNLIFKTIGFFPAQPSKQPFTLLLSFYFHNCHGDPQLNRERKNNYFWWIFKFVCFLQNKIVIIFCSKYKLQCNMELTNYVSSS